MPKRFFIAFALAAVALVACNNYNPYGLTGPTPTPSPSPSYSPNPGITAANVLFSVASTPIPNQPVAMSTPDPSGRPGAAIATVITNSTGTSTFSGLTPAQTYCWTTMYTPPGTSPQNYSVCAFPQYWQAGVVKLGNP